MVDALDGLRDFLVELKRRKVYRVAVAYVVVAVGALELVDIVVPATRLPEGSQEFFLALTVLGFPLSIFLAWAFEVTPDGVRRTAPPPGDESGEEEWDRDVRTLAVLPFENISGTGDAEPFAAGLHDDLLTELSRISALTVISRTSVLRYRDTDKSIPQVARELQVGTVLEGSVQLVADRVRLNVQLIDAGTDAHRWAERYDRELSARSIFGIQSELATKIAATLHAQLTPQEQERVMEWAPTENLEAYRLNIEGRVHLDERTEKGMRRAVERFRSAIAEDASYAPAWVGLADALTLLYEYGYEDVQQALPEARKSVARALHLDPELAAAHASQGLIHEAGHEGPPAIRELKRAVELQPSYAEGHNWLSWTWLELGNAEEGLASARRAVELNPLSPEAVSNLALGLVSNGRSEEAVREARRARDLQPTYDTPPFYEALALLDLGRFDEAKEILDGLEVPWSGSGPVVTMALARAISGDAEGARTLLRRFEEDGDDFGAAMVHAAFGNVEPALEALERIDRWDHWQTLAMHHHYRAVLEPLRDRPRFRALLERINRQWGLNPDGSFPAG